MFLALLCWGFLPSSSDPVVVQQRPPSASIPCSRRLFTVPVQLDGATRRMAACIGDDGASVGAGGAAAYSSSALRFCAQHGLACDAALRERHCTRRHAHGGCTDADAPAGCGCADESVVFTGAASQYTRRGPATEPHPGCSTPPARAATATIWARDNGK